MKIEFEVSRDVQINFVVHMRRNSKALRLETLILRWLALVLMSGLAVLTALQGRLIDSWVLFAIGFVFFFVYPPIVLWYVRLMARKLVEEGSLPCSAGRCELELSETDVYAKTKYVTSRIQWPAFAKLEATQEHLYLYTKLGGVLIIPRSACDKAAFDEFEATLRGYLQDSKGAA